MLNNCAIDYYSETFLYPGTEPVSEKAQFVIESIFNVFFCLPGVFNHSP